METEEGRKDMGKPGDDIRTGCLMVSAAASGCGKSVVTMGLLQAMKERGIRLRSFKCGPDYIDPGFHTRVLGIPCRNLDTYLMGENEVLDEMQEAVRSGFFAVAEGAMGFYDGLGGGAQHSACSIAALCQMPVLAVLDAGQKVSCGDQLGGLLEKDTEKRICCVLINRCTKEEYPKILFGMTQVFTKERLTLRTMQGTGGFAKHLSQADPGGFAKHLPQTDSGGFAKHLFQTDSGGNTGREITICGHLPPMQEAEFPSRHLGLVGAAQAEDFARRIHRIAEALKTAGCVDAILAAAGTPSMGTSVSTKGIPAGTVTEDAAPDMKQPCCETFDLKRTACCRIAVARDEAFSFFYQRSLENLERAGARLCFFSPLHDSDLPDHVDGLYLPGGYPELYAEVLEKNAAMRRAVREAVSGGLPTVAECGGFLYLGKTLCSEDGHPYEMAGVLPGSASGKERLVRFGYLELTQEKGDSLLFQEGETVTAHEFHYWDSDSCGEDLLARKKSKNQDWRCGFAGENLYAAFPHLYLNKKRAERFVRACMQRP